MGLRGLTLASKFVLLMYLVRYFAAESVGVYGLIAVTISIALYFLGADFYVYSTREILAHPRGEMPVMIRDQFVMHLLAYGLVMPTLLTLFAANLIGWRFALWFYGILILEHLSQEAYRLLVALSRPAMANFILFLRSGAWIYAVVGLGIISNDYRHLPIIWAGWLIGGAASVIMAAHTLRHYSWSETNGVAINWSWIRSGLRTAMPYLLASLCLLSVQFADRYAIKAFRGEAQLGIYTFYAQIANTVQLLITTGVTSLIYPKLISAHQARDYVTFRHLFRKMTAGVVGGTILLCAVIALAMPFVVGLVNREHITEYKPVLWLLLAGNGLLTLSHIPHFSLYALGKDRAVVVSTVIASVITVTLDCILVPMYGLYGAALGMLAGGSILLISKTAMNIAVTRHLGDTPAIAEAAKFVTEPERISAR